MKKQKCGFRQKLGIVLAAGMIISNVSFAVLPVSATDSANNPTQETTIDPEVQEVLNAIDSLPSLEEVKEKSFEEQIAIRDKVETIAEKVKNLVENQKELPENATAPVTVLQNYFNALAETDINPIEEGGQPTELTAEAKTAIVDTVSDYLAGEIKKIAAGTRANTEIDVFNLIYTGSNATDVEALFKEIEDKSKEMFQSLLITYQNDLYWFDKSYQDATIQGGFSFSGNYEIVGTAVTGSAVFRFVVSPEYRVSADNLYTLDTAKINSANTALVKAQAIVDANAGKSDYEKLLAYKNAICEMTSYNHDAASDSYSGTNEPWQMVSVFEGKQVVCEGYSKAFQYLCDLSTFKYAKCYTVTGQMAGGTGAGGHMWNIVSIGSNNYLVDVTNCDDGSIGAPDKLFMAIPSSGTWNGTYAFALSRTISYAYDPSQISYYGESILKLSTTPYDPTKDPVVDDPTDKPGTDNPDDNKPNKPNRPSKPTTPSKPGSSSSSSDSGNQTGDNTSTQTTPTTIWAVETSPSDQNNYRLEVRSAIEVPAELAGNDTLNTPQKIESQIRSSLTAKGISNDNIRVYDVALQVYANGTWQDVSAENFPAEGVTVTVPYPSGTDSTYNFVASHLFTKSMNGFPAGHIETFPESGAITTSSAGISFTVHGLSPISVGWSKAAAGTSTNVSPKTGDQSTILLYMVLMILAAAVMGTVYVKQIRVRRK